MGLKICCYRIYWSIEVERAMIDKVMIFYKVYLARVMKKCVRNLLIYKSRKRNDRGSNEFSIIFHRSQKRNDRGSNKFFIIYM